MIVTGHDGDDFPVDVYEAAPGSPVVIAAHGMSGSRDAPYISGMAKAWSRSGITVLSADAPHHGARRSTSPPGPMEVLMAAHRLVERAAGDLGSVVDAAFARFDPPAIGLLGFSMGGVTAAFVAARHPRIASTMLVITGSTWAAARTRTPMALMAAAHIKRADPVSVAPRITTPVAMLQADQDEIFDRNAAMAVYESLGGPKAIRFLPGTHSQWRQPAQWYRRMRWWFDVTLGS